jgi:hypothetical protein
MADLLQRYFEADLGEAEEEELGSQLASSPEEALRFAQLAEADWLRLGLAAPRLAARRHSRLAWWGGAALLAAAAWNLGNEAGRPTRPDLGVSQSPFRVVLPEAAAAQEEPSGDLAGLRLEARALPGREGQFGLELSGLLKGARAAAYGAAGQKLADLEKTGPRSWNWDGRSAGLEVGPGRYQLKVEGGGRTYAKWIEIETRQP